MTSNYTPSLDKFRKKQKRDLKYNENVIAYLQADCYQCMELLSYFSRAENIANEIENHQKKT